MKKIVSLAIAASAIAFPTAAFAQDSQADVTIGASVGLHDLGIADEAEDEFGVAVDDSAEIYGAFISVDFPVGENLFAGVEGNVHLASGPLDADYGASARFGFLTENGSKIYVRGGYQFVEIDALGALGLDEDDLPAGFDEDDFNETVDDYLVGVGVDFPVGESVMLRANVDTISFDTLRGTVGVGFRF